MRTVLHSILASCVLAGLGHAQFTISEAFINPPGADNGFEAIEIRGAANAALTGYSLIAIEGDGSNAGTVDTVINLGSTSTGANGLLLMRDSTTVLLPAPATGTSVVVDAAGFTNDIENGTITLVLGRGTAPMKGADLDANNDGTLDMGIPGFTVVDAVSYTDGGSSDLMYAASIGGYNFPDTGAFTPDAIYRIYDAAGKAWCWTAADVVSATAGGPYTFDWMGDDYQGGLSEGFGPQQLDLGTPNGTLSFCADVYAISLAAGGTQTLNLDVGTSNAAGFFVIIGSLSGTKPGIVLSGSITIPANLDPYTTLLLGAPNSLMMPSVGVLDAMGRATSKFTLPAMSPAMVGMEFNHAALILDRTASSFVGASTPTTLFIQN